MTASECLTAEIVELLSVGLAKVEAARAELVYSDTVGCILSGLTDAQVSAFAGCLPQGHATEPVTGRCHPAGDMAMLFGFAAAADELDEGHYEAGGHPAAPVVAAILADNAVQRVAADAVLQAFVAGYEVGARLGRALDLRPDVHPHGTWGVVGAAIAVAILRSVPAIDWPCIIDLAASLATATSFDTPLLGGSIRSVWIGVSARNGLLACDLAAAGVTAGPAAVERILGNMSATSVNTENLKRRQGEPLLHMTNFMKLEASCRETQSALAALDTALADHDLLHSEIVGIEIETYHEACRLDRPDAENFTAARFSVPCVIAGRLLQGKIRPDCFSEPLLGSEDFLRLSRLIKVKQMAIPSISSAPNRFSRIIISLADGSHLEGTSELCPGDPSSPLDKRILETKFDAILGHGPQAWRHENFDR